MQETEGGTVYKQYSLIDRNNKDSKRMNMYLQIDAALPCVSPFSHCGHTIV